MANAAVKTKEFRAEAKFQRTSPQKAKLVLDLIKASAWSRRSTRSTSARSALLP